MSELPKRLLAHLISVAEDNIISVSDIKKSIEGLENDPQTVREVAAALSRHDIEIDFDDASEEEPLLTLDDDEGDLPEDISEELFEEEMGADYLGMYLSENRQTGLLSAEEEVDLAKKMEAGLEAEERLENETLSYKERMHLCHIKELGECARKRLVKGNTRLVISIAKRYREQGLDFLDLIQEGNVGLLTAVDKYDYRLGNRFSTYATWWIRQSITRALANHSRTIRIPANQYTHIRKLYRLKRDLEQEKGRPPTTEELAAAMDTSISRVNWLFEITRPLLSLEQPAGQERDAELGNYVEDDVRAQPVETVSGRMLREQLQSLINSLPSREALILCLRYGLEGHEPHTLSELGNMLHLSRERVRQIEKGALKKLALPTMGGHLRHYLT